ncbi:hypothetical protein [Bradyrhizobium sp. MOS002]|uniref:hypothetical protein n=1 Tax=Bradyrhizobium sp. MOS002 TaxID=2133947 RepID=UPI0011B21073|nr:hypothetical protein [Bradyrhizobium sp. MOS002]
MMEAIAAAIVFLDRCWIGAPLRCVSFASVSQEKRHFAAGLESAPHDRPHIIFSGPLATFSRSDSHLQMHRLIVLHHPPKAGQFGGCVQ